MKRLHTFAIVYYDKNGENTLYVESESMQKAIEFFEVAYEMIFGYSFISIRSV